VTLKLAIAAQRGAEHMKEQEARMAITEATLEDRTEGRRGPVCVQGSRDGRSSPGRRA